MCPWFSPYLQKFNSPVSEVRFLACSSSPGGRQRRSRVGSDPHRLPVLASPKAERQSLDQLLDCLSNLVPRHRRQLLENFVSRNLLGAGLTSLPVPPPAPL